MARVLKRKLEWSGTSGEHRAGLGRRRCCARTKSVANALATVELHLNPAIWEAIAATGWRLLSDCRGIRVK
jgi:hypothetical protein